MLKHPKWQDNRVDGDLGHRVDEVGVRAVVCSRIYRSIIVFWDKL